MRAPRIADLDRVDIALFGIPFDLGLAYRPGSRHAPAAVREASRVIRRVNPTTKVNPFELCQVVGRRRRQLPPVRLRRLRSMP